MYSWFNQRRRATYSVYLIMFMDMFAVSLFIPHIKFRMKSIGLSDLTIGIITSAYGIVQLISTPIMGNFSDIYNRKIVLLLCLFVPAISYIFMGITTNIFLFGIMRLLAGCFKHTQVLGKTMLSELAYRNGIHLSSLLGSSEAFGTMGFTLGPLVGGYFIQNDDGFPILCIAASAIFMFNIFLTVVLIPALENSISKSNDYQLSSKKEIQDGDDIGDDDTKELIPIIVLNFLFCLAIHIVRESAPFMLKEKYDTSTLQMGYMYSLQNFASTLTGFMIGSLVSGIYKENSKMMVVHGGMLQLVSVLFLLNTTSFNFACIGMVLQSVANQFLAVGLKYLALLGTTHEGATLGILQTASSSSRVLAPVLVGYFGSYHNEVTLMAASSALLGLLGTLQFVQELSVAKIKEKVL